MTRGGLSGGQFYRGKSTWGKMTGGNCPGGNWWEGIVSEANIQGGKDMEPFVSVVSRGFGGGFVRCDGRSGQIVGTASGFNIQRTKSPFFDFLKLK